jgi:hypothetical protein
MILVKLFPVVNCRANLDTGALPAPVTILKLSYQLMQEPRCNFYIWACYSAEII